MKRVLILFQQENLGNANFPGVGKYDIPEIQPEYIDIHRLEWIPFNYAKTAKDRANKGIHFYIDDYQFTRLWQRPAEYIDMLQEFGAVCTPDFSLYSEMPFTLQLYNHYRKQWLGAYWQALGIHVIPTLCWCGLSSFEWCLDGTPKNSIVSISNVGARNSAKERDAFSVQCQKAIEILQPSEILWNGKCPLEFDWNVTYIKTHQERMRERIKTAPHQSAAPAIEKNDKGKSK